MSIARCRSGRPSRWALTVFSDRVRELRDTGRSYDAYYVALAEALDGPRHV